MKLVKFNNESFLMELSDEIERAGGNLKVRYADLTTEEYHWLRCDAADLPYSTPNSELKHISTIRGVHIYVDGVPADDLARKEFQDQLNKVLLDADGGDFDGTPPRLQ